MIGKTKLVFIWIIICSANNLIRILQMQSDEALLFLSEKRHARTEKPLTTLQAIVCGLRLSTESL